MRKYWWIRWIPIWILALILGWMISDGVLAQEESLEQLPPVNAQTITDPQYVVSYDYRMTMQEPLLNLRVMTSAKDTNDAVNKSTMFIVQKLGAVLNLDYLRCVDSGLAHGQEPVLTTKNEKEEKKEEKK